MSYTRTNSCGINDFGKQTIGSVGTKMSIYYTRSHVYVDYRGYSDFLACLYEVNINVNVLGLTRGNICF